MISYAQNFEDVILMRALRDVWAGTYVDIGANDPAVDSVSKAFYDAGWRGLHVEPVPAYAQSLRKARPDETVIEAAVSTAEGPIQLFDIAETGLSTGNADFAERHRAEGFESRTIQVETITLAKLLRRFNDADIHWLKVDVEGMERDVLASWADAAQRPWIVVVESTLPNSSEPAFEEWEPELIARGYDCVYFDGLNRFYLHEAEAARAVHFGPGPHAFDDFTLSLTSPFVGVVKEAWAAEVATLRSSIAEHEAAAREAAQRERALQDQLTEVVLREEAAAREAAQRERALQERLTEAALREAELAGRAAEQQTERDRAQHELALAQTRCADLQRHVADLEAQSRLRPELDGLRQRVDTLEEQLTELRRAGGGTLLTRRDGVPRWLVRRALFHTSGKPRGLMRRLVLDANELPRTVFRTWMYSPAYLGMRKPHRVPRNQQAASRRKTLLHFLFTRRSGRPIRPVRRTFFHSSGKPRSLFRSVVLQPSGAPRDFFRPWMESPEYALLPKAHRHHVSAPALPAGAPVHQAPASAPMSAEDELSYLMERIRQELAVEQA